MTRIEHAGYLVRTLRAIGSFGASTDVGGIFADPNLVYTFYDTLARQLHFTQPPLLELVHFRTIKRFSRPTRVAGIHSRIGTINAKDAQSAHEFLNTIIVCMLNYLMHPHTSSIRYSEQASVRGRPTYVNMHSRFVLQLSSAQMTEISQIQQRTSQNGRPSFLVAIENDVCEDWSSTQNHAGRQLTEHEIVWIRLLDICHMMRSEQFSMQHHGQSEQAIYIQAWNRMLKHVEAYHDEPLLIHAPYGTRLNDSLRSTYIDETMLRDFFTLLPTYFVILENQQEHGLINNNPNSSKGEFTRLINIFERLLTAGVLTL